MRHSGFFSGRNRTSDGWRFERDRDEDTGFGTNNDWDWQGSYWGNHWRDWYQHRQQDWKNDWKGWDWSWHGWMKWLCPDDDAPPDAVDDALTVLTPGGTITGSLLGNDTDGDGDTLAVTQINGVEAQVGVPLQLSGGMVTVEADGSYTVQANEDFTFTYTVSDGRSSDTATVNVDVLDPVYFAAFNSDGLPEIWQTNGTPEGTTRFFDDELAEALEYAGWLTRFGDGFLISGNNEPFNAEPWYTDGTIEGTFELAELNNGSPPGSNPSQFTAVGGKVVFAALSNDVGTELFVSDGTPGGTGLLADIREALGTSNPTGFLTVGNFVYFSAGTEEEGLELWRTDGTSEGTLLLADLNPGPDSSLAVPLFELDGVVAIRANQSSDNTGELWIADGSPLGTTLLADEVTGAGLGLDGDAFFFKRDSGGQFDLWRSDGTANGTELVADIDVYGPGSSVSTELGETLLFVTNYRTSGGFELWSTDGTQDGTFMVRNINSIGDDQGHSPARYDPEFTSVGDGFVFVVDDGVNGREPWFTDGTYDGTYLIKDINPDGNSNVRFDSSAYIDGRIVFAAFEPDTGKELWISDGTPDGTSMLADLQEGPGWSDPFDFVV